MVIIFSKNTNGNTILLRELLLKPKHFPLLTSKQIHSKILLDSCFTEMFHNCKNSVLAMLLMLLDLTLNHLQMIYYISQEKMLNRYNNK